MQVTNKLNLPKALIKAVDIEPHNKTNKELSATTLLKGVKEIILTWRHWEELVVDVSDRIWALFGTAVHSLLETESENEFSECEFELKLENGITITGKIDNYNMETGEITDFKSGAVYKVQLGDFEDWRKQGFVYAFLLVKNGFKANHCRFIDFLKDHSKSKAKFDSGYPQSPVYIFEFSVTDSLLFEAKDFIKEKTDNYLKYIDTPDDEIPPCSDKERWASETEYAVMKTGNKRAVKKFTNRFEADNLAAEKGAGHYVEIRPGVSRKCADYCICCDHCNFYNNIVKNQTSEE